jgi:hypothetical protein
MYHGCKSNYTKLVTVLELMQMKQMFGWSDKSVTKLLTFLQDLLPGKSHMPDSFYKAKIILCPLEMEVQRIYACKLAFVDPGNASQANMDFSEWNVEDYILNMFKNCKDQDLILWPYLKK